mmetsp:Transcript_49620/g.126410  ORF Transcript_49620/g.126410 Transcript_49620/m.126410 type:complete len:331 (-) Transcript_49620:30-1022(-)
MGAATTTSCAASAEASTTAAMSTASRWPSNCSSSSLACPSLAATTMFGTQATPMLTAPAALIRASTASSVLTIGMASDGDGAGGSGCGAATATHQSGRGGGSLVSPGKSLSGTSQERPQRHLADSKSLTARLEGENEALKRAVSRARVEISQMERRHAAFEARNKTLSSENASAAQALRRCAGVVGAGGKAAEAGTESSPASIPGRMTMATPDAAATLRRLVLPANGSCASSCGGAMPVSSSEAAELPRLLLSSGRVVGDSHSGGGGNGDGMPCSARDQLLEKSNEVGRRFEEILSRRGGKLQAVLLSDSAPNGRSAPGTAEGFGESREE